MSKERKSRTDKRDPHASRKTLLFHYCRLQWPAILLGPDSFRTQLQRAYEVYRAKDGPRSSWDRFFDQLYVLDWYVASGCLLGLPRAWDILFAARAGRSDCLLVDALRARASRLYPRDEERQENAVAAFWGLLLVAETPGAAPILARYDGQRPLVPWLIRVFQNWNVSKLRHRHPVFSLPDDDVAGPPEASAADSRWHDVFRQAARDAFGELTEPELLILGLRLRYRMSQREVAGLLGVHEGTVSRQTSQLRERCLQIISRRLVDEGWTGEDLSDFVLNEMGNLLLDEPRLAADQLARALARRGKALPKAPDEPP